MALDKDNLSESELKSIVENIYKAYKEGDIALALQETLNILEDYPDMLSLRALAARIFYDIGSTQHAIFELNQLVAKSTNNKIKTLAQKLLDYLDSGIELESDFSSENSDKDEEEVAEVEIDI